MNELTIRSPLSEALHAAGVKDAYRLLASWENVFVPTFRVLFIRDAYRQFYQPDTVEMSFIEGFEETIRKSGRANVIVAMEIARARVEEALEKEKEGRYG